MHRLGRRPSPDADRPRKVLAGPLAARLGKALAEEGRDCAEVAAAGALLVRSAAFTLLDPGHPAADREQFLARMARRVAADRELCQDLADFLCRTNRYRPDEALWLLACALVDLTDGLLRRQREEERRRDPFGEG
jgi:hypothetical protein